MADAFEFHSDCAQSAAFWPSADRTGPIYSIGFSPNPADVKIAVGSLREAPNEENRLTIVAHDANTSSLQPIAQAPVSPVSSTRSRRSCSTHPRPSDLALCDSRRMSSRAQSAQDQQQENC